MMKSSVLRENTPSLLRAEYEKLYDDAAQGYQEAVQAHNEQRILQNKAIMSYLDRALAELGEQ